LSSSAPSAALEDIEQAIEERSERLDVIPARILGTVRHDHPELCRDDARQMERKCTAIDAAFRGPHACSLRGSGAGAQQQGCSGNGSSRELSDGRRSATG
jgi:hypothetical protein